MRRSRFSYRGTVLILAILATVVATTLSIGNFFLPVGAPAAAFPANVTTNPSFEWDTSGWVGWQSTITRVARAGAPSGLYVARVSRTSGTAYSIDDAMPSVAATAVGASYSTQAYVAAAAAVTVGKKVSLVLRERSSSGAEISTSESQPVVLTTAFQRLDVTATSYTAGSRVEVYVIQEQGGVAGDAFFVDAITLSRVNDVLPRATSKPVSSSAQPDDSAAARFPHGPTGDWALRFDDEFDGTTLDQSRWNTGWFGTGVTRAVNPAEIACYNSDNVSVTGGDLKLALRNQPETCAGKTQPYSGAMVNTNNKYEYTYGYAEVRMFIPATADGTMANWPVFWTNGANWPKDGEDDIAEGLRGRMDYRYHYADASGNYQTQGFTLPQNWSGWHTFGAEWAAGSTKYFYDGVLVGQLSAGSSSPNYLILAYTQGQWLGPTVTPADLLVDYVRVWQH
jgi:beta-glucanase (GH16 family)